MMDDLHDAAAVLRRRLQALAGEVGRLHRRLDGETYDGFLVSRIADHVETLDAILEPTAHDVYIERLALGASDDEAVVEALDMVDARCQELRAALGRGKAQ